MLRATTTCACTFQSQLPNSAPDLILSYFVHFYLDMSSPRNAVCFLNSSTSKSGPSMLCFHYFDLETCFATQSPKIFSHLSFQKCSTLLCARRARNFSSLISPDGYAPACLASLFFDPSEPQNIGKTSCFATFLPCRTPASTFF